MPRDAPGLPGGDRPRRAVAPWRAGNPATIEWSDPFAAVRRLDPNSPQNQRLQMQAEAWRDALIEDAEAITRFVDSYPAVDVQHLRQLQRGARAESAREEYGKASRALFLEVRAVIEDGEANQEEGSDH